jgi:hypothetical protein
MRLHIVKNEQGGWVVVDAKTRVPLDSQPALGWTSRANALMFGARLGRVVLAGA